MLRFFDDSFNARRQLQHRLVLFELLQVLLLICYELHLADISGEGLPLEYEILFFFVLLRELVQLSNTLLKLEYAPLNLRVVLLDVCFEDANRLD